MTRHYRTQTMSAMWKFALARGGEDKVLVHATIRMQLNVEEGKPIGYAPTNPLLLDSRKYEIESADGHLDQSPANGIAENLIAQADKECHRQMKLVEIMDHRVLNDAIS
jgi:hypothetical protein